MKIHNFFEASASFELAPLEALKYFLKKGLRPTFAWQDMVAEEHDLALTVAKMMDIDLLKLVDKNLQQALVQGTTLAEFKAQLIPTLQKQPAKCLCRRNVAADTAELIHNALPDV